MPDILEKLGLAHVIVAQDEGYLMFDLQAAPVRISPSLAPHGDLATSVACQVVTSVFSLGTVCDLPLRPPC